MLGPRQPGTIGAMQLASPIPGSLTLRRPAMTATQATLLLASTFTVYWLVVLGLDAHTTAPQQLGLGLCTWAFLLVVLALAPAQERVQVIAMVLVATGFECLCSIGLGVYRYRLDNLPMYVPPGHGLFFYMALRTSNLPLVQRHGRTVIGVVAAGSVVLALRGLLFTEGNDLFGVGAWIAFALFMLRGQYPLFYAVSFTITMVLEFYGTGLGLWAWAPITPIIGLSAANPPAGIGSGYCVMDHLARALAPRLTAWRAAARSSFPWAARPIPKEEIA
jgi:hypothetical protein